MKYLISFLVAIFLVSAASSQSKIWSLKDCIEQAEKNNLSLKRSELTYNQNNINHTQAKSARMPTLSAYASQGFNFGRSIDPTTNQFAQQAIRSNNFNLNASMVLFGGMQIHHFIQQQKLLEASGEYGYERAKNDLRLAVITSYVQILMNVSQLKAARIQMEITTQQVERAEKQMQAGVLTDAVLAHFLAQQASDEMNVVNIENQLTIAKAQLSQYLQLPEQEYDIEDMILQDYEVSENANSAEMIYKAATENMPQAKEALLRTRSSRIAIKAVKGSRFPLLTMNASAASYFSSQSKEVIMPNFIIRDIPFREQVKRNLGQYAGLQLSIPIINNGIIKGNIQRARINYDLAQTNELLVKNQIRLEIETACSNLRAASSKYKASSRQWNARKVSYAAADKKFIAGVMNSYDFILEKNNVLQAELLFIQSQYEYMLRQKIVDFYKTGSVQKNL